MGIRATTRGLIIASVVVSAPMLALAACAPADNGATGVVGVPNASTTTSRPPTTSPSTTSSTTTTTLPPTTTTTAPPWPLTPVAPVAASGAVREISRVETSDPVVFLTLDDGIVRDPRVLDLVEQFRIPVTVFVNEGPLRADPEYFRRITAFGGSINSHTRSHPNLVKVSAGRTRDEMCGMRDVIGEYVWFPGHLFRSPYGVTTSTVLSAASSCGINAVLHWRATIDDGHMHFQQPGGLQPGDIVLGHFRPMLYEDICALWWQAASQGLTIAPIEAYLPLP